MRRRTSVAKFCVALALAAAGCGREQRDESGASTKATVEPTKTSPQTRGVATIRAELAQQCTARIGTAESGDPATEEVVSLVDEFVDAYAAGPKNAATSGIAENVLETMRNGCGPDQRDKIEQALGMDAGDGEPTPEVTAEPTPDTPGVGDSIILSGQEGAEVRVKVLRVIDPLSGGEFDEASSNKRYVGVEVQLTNVGDVPYDDSPSNGAVIIYGDDRQENATLVTGGPCSGGFASSVKLRPGARRRGCIPFELPRSRKPKLFQFALDSGFSDDLGEWKLR